MAFNMPSFISRFTSSAAASKLGISSETASSSAVPANAERATVAAGCFWGVEHVFRKHFGNGKGLLDAKVGYIGGDLTNPSYKQVCSGKSGHAEAAQLIFDPSKVTYRQLLEFFYKMHDPTTANRQGPDNGTQYRSGIYFHTPEQEKVAREVTAAVNGKWWKGKVVTEIVPAGKWWDAEEYHQLYLNKNPFGYECPSHFVRNFPPLDE